MSAEDFKLVARSCLGPSVVAVGRRSQLQDSLDEV
jgi:hypothetical protein